MTITLGGIFGRSRPGMTSNKAWYLIEVIAQLRFNPSAERTVSLYTNCVQEQASSRFSCAHQQPQLNTALLLFRNPLAQCGTILR